MIAIGYSEEAKRSAIAREAKARGVDQVFILAPERFTTRLDALEGSGLPVDYVEWLDTYRYKTMYRLFQAINQRSLLVINECLRSQERSLLRFNCIRHYTLQTDHVLVFQHLPLIDTLDDFSVLFDFVTKSRWKREPFGKLPLREAQIVVNQKTYSIESVPVETDKNTKAKYAKEKKKLFDNIGLRDPHTIPRNLHLLAGKSKVGYIDPWGDYIARNQRLKLNNITSIRDVSGPTDATLVDFPHRFIDFADFLATSGQTRVRALVTDLRVDQWYLERYQAWCQRVNDAQATLLG